MNGIFQMVVPVVVIGGLIGSILLTKNRLQAIREKTDLKGKMADYRATQILKYALIEGPSLLAIVAYLLTGSMYLLGFAAIMIVALYMNRPTRDAAANDLELSIDERAVIDESTPEYVSQDQIHLDQETLKGLILD